MFSVADVRDAGRRSLPCSAAVISGREAKLSVPGDARARVDEREAALVDDHDPRARVICA